MSDPLRRVVGLLEAVGKEFPIDPKRVYVTGVSMGGSATWDLVSRRPELFAAAVPVCGGVDAAGVANGGPGAGVGVPGGEGRGGPAGDAAAGRGGAAEGRRHAEVHRVPRRRARRLEAGVRRAGAVRLAVRAGAGLTEWGPTPPPPRFAVPRSGGLLAGMLLALSVLNYIDRQALSVLAETIQRDLGIDDRQYGWVTQAFLVCYALMYVPSGWVVDRLGPRRAETLFILWWSAANILTGWARGLTSLVACRGLLGLGEPGHYAASAKVVAEWFPPREKARRGRHVRHGRHARGRDRRARWSSG